MAARQRVRRGSRRNFAGLVITLGLHGCVLAAVAAAHNQTQPPLIVSHDFVVAEMVKLGKPRDKFWLPRLQQPVRSTAPPQTLKVADDPSAKPAPKEAPRPDDPTISKDMRRALDRLKKLQALEMPEPDDEGALNGSKLGASNRAVGDQYLAQIKGLLQQNYNLPAGLTPDQIAIHPEIEVRWTADGRITSVVLIKPSGNSFVDDACVDAAKLTGKVPPPPPNARHGMRIECTK
jgi:TonB family protein